MEMGVIYKATSQTSNKSYIGQTINFERRKNDHRKTNDGYAFHNAIQKYGFEDFVWETLEECPREKLDEREMYWIQYYDTYHDGYNSTLGGDNANSLLNWKAKNKDKEHEYALNGLKYAQQHNLEYREQHLAHLASVRDKALEARRKKVRCIELDLVFDSLSAAEEWSMSPDNPNGKKSAHQHISKVCKGQRKTCGGYHWEYI